jgi:hypothetical protein
VIRLAPSASVVVLSHLFPFSLIVVMHTHTQAFWRGATTGYGWDPAVAVPENHRRTLLEKWGASTDPRFDIGISAYVQEVQDGTPQR